MAEPGRDPPPPTDNEVLMHLQEQTQQLTTVVQALTLQLELKENPLAEHGDNYGDDRRWEYVFKLEIPEFNGGESPEELLDWFGTVDETLESRRVPLERCVPMITMRFRGKAALWWTQLKTSRARLGKPRILSWDKLKMKMRKKFLPLNYEQTLLQRLTKLRQGGRSVEEYSTEFFMLLKRLNLQNSDRQILVRFVAGLRRSFRENLLNPLTIADAHQQAMTLEPKIEEDKYQRKEVAFYVGCCCFLLYLLRSCR